MARALTILKRAVVLAAVWTISVSVLSFAGAPKFFSATSGVNDSGALVVSFDERGLGNENVVYTLTADATATYACINGGGKNPSAANKRSLQGQVSGGGSFEPKNGRVLGTLKTGPLSAGGFSCPPGQKLVLSAVSYSNVVLTDTTNGVPTNVLDASRTLLAL